MSKEITYKPINFKRISNITNESVDIKKAEKKAVRKKKVELLADVASDVGTTHKHKMIRYISYAVIVVAVAFTILFRYTMVSSNTAEISQLKREYIGLSDKNVNLQCEIDSLTDSDSIEEAAARLGMARPSKSQKITVDVVGGDYVEIADPETAAGTESAQFYATMIETLGNVLEYLY